MNYHEQTDRPARAGTGRGLTGKRNSVYGRGSVRTRRRSGNTPSTDSAEKGHVIRQIYNALRDVYRNERELFARYDINEKHTKLEKKAFGFSTENMQNLDAVLGMLEEIMESEMEKNNELGE